MTLLLVGGFTVISLVMFWAPSFPLFKRFDEPEEPRRQA